MLSPKICIVLYLFLYAFSAACGNKNTKPLPGQAAEQPMSGEQKDQSAQLLETTSKMLKAHQDTKKNALNELEKASKKSLCKKAPDNKAEIDLFIQTHRAHSAESQRLQPTYGPVIVALATGESELVFWHEYERLMEGLEGKK